MDCPEEGDRRSAGGRIAIGQRVTREARRSGVNRLRWIDLARVFDNDGFMKLKVMETGSGLSALRRTRRRQFHFRDNRPPIRAGFMAFDKWFTRVAAAMPFSHAAFHRADFRLASNQR